MANEKLIDANKYPCRSCGKTYCHQNCKEFIEWLENPVDAVEVVHGRWIDEYPYVRCSECNAEWVNCRTDNEPSLFYYCPNCGAKMDGDGNG